MTAVYGENPVLNGANIRNLFESLGTLGIRGIAPILHVLRDRRIDYSPYITYLNRASRESSVHFDEPFALLRLAQDNLDHIFDEWEREGPRVRAFMRRILRYFAF